MAAMGVSNQSASLKRGEQYIKSLARARPPVEPHCFGVRRMVACAVAAAAAHPSTSGLGSGSLGGVGDRRALLASPEVGRPFAGSAASKAPMASAGMASVSATEVEQCKLQLSSAVENVSKNSLHGVL